MPTLSSRRFAIADLTGWRADMKINIDMVRAEILVEQVKLMRRWFDGYEEARGTKSTMPNELWQLHIFLSDIVDRKNKRG